MVSIEWNTKGQNFGILMKTVKRLEADEGQKLIFDHFCNYSPKSGKLKLK